MKARTGFLMITPAMVIIFFILVIPLFFTVYCSLQSLNYLQFGDFVGLSNYAKLLGDSAIMQSFGRTFFVSLMATGISMVLGFALALWVNSRTGPYAYLVQMIGLIPWVISMVVGALLWRWLFNNDLGLINFIIRKLGGEGLKVFQNKNQSVALLIGVMSWRTIGYSMVMVLAGLKGVSMNLIEAAQVDGAHGGQVFWHIQLPLVKTPALISVIVLTMSNFNNNTVPMVLTSGGPGTATNVISLHLYKLSFTYYQFGMSSALALLIFAVNILMAVLYIRMVKYEI